MTYPCPYCHAPADETAGCAGCGRPPDPEAAEVVRLDGVLATLRAEADARRQAYTAAMNRFEEVRRRRNDLAARVSARIRAAAFVAPAAPASTAPPARPAGPETSTRTVQNVLYVLGGLLLACAAVVFTAVAWATVGVTGRAAILAAVTALVLAAGPLAGRRGLTGTAETAAALGLLLVGLDGYAAWYVNLAGVAHAVRPSGYAALVCAATTVVAAGYARLTGLSAPRYAALVAAQPVAPLLAVAAGTGASGWAVALVAVALYDLGVARLVRRGRAVAAVAWVCAGVALTWGTTLALGAVALAGTPAEAVRAAAALLAAAGAALAGALVTGRLRPAAAGVLAAAVGVAVARVLGVTWPAMQLVLYPATAAGLALTVAALPARVRRGPRVAVLVLGGLVAVPPAVEALAGGLRTVRAALPVWHAGAPAGPWADWQLPAAVALAALGLAVLLPRRVAVLASAAVLLALAVPAAVALPGWGPSTVDGLVVVALLATRRRTTLVAAAVPVLHAVGAGLGRPSTTALVLAGVVAAAAFVAARRTDPVPGAVATAGALLALPALAGAAAAWAGWPALPWAAAGLVVAGAGAVAVRRVYGPAAALAVGVAGAGVTLAAVPDGRLGAYAALAVLLDVAVWRLVRPRVEWLLAGVVPAAVALVVVAPAVWTVLGAPYARLGTVWAGRPDGTGLPAVSGTAALTLAGLVLATAVGTGRRRADWTAVPALPALLAGAAALGARWPTVPALSVGAAAGLALAAALAAALGRRGRLGWLVGPAAGAGLAGALATPAATLWALGAGVVTAVVCGAAGRTALARTLGWLTGVAATAALGLVAGLAADLAVRSAAFAVLAAGALALGGSAGLARSGRGGEARAVESGAHAVAAVALLLTVPSAAHTAAVCTLWGVALGLRALWPAGTGWRVRGGAALAAELVAYWLLLATRQVTVLEAYTLPAAGLALLAGWLAVRHRPELRSWTAYAPALLAGFGPSLAAVLVSGGDPVRRLALGVGALAVVLGGAAGRRQAPVVVGGAVLVLLALHETVLLWDRLPRWVPLAVAGVLLVAVAMRYERRRRDLGRLREAVGRMR